MAAPARRHTASHPLVAWLLGLLLAAALPSRRAQTKAAAVITPSQLKAAIAARAEHIVIQEHLDMSEDQPEAVLGSDGAALLPALLVPTEGTRSIRVRCHDPAVYYSRACRSSCRCSGRRHRACDGVHVLQRTRSAARAPAATLQRPRALCRATAPGSRGHRCLWTRRSSVGSASF